MLLEQEEEKRKKSNVYLQVVQEDITYVTLRHNLRCTVVSKSLIEKLNYI